MILTSQPPTDRELHVLSIVARQIDKDGTQPTYREVCRLMGWKSPNAVRKVVVSLQAKGVVTVADGHGISFQWRRYL